MFEIEEACTGELRACGEAWTVGDEQYNGVTVKRQIFAFRVLYSKVASADNSIPCYRVRARRMTLAVFSQEQVPKFCYGFRSHLCCLKERAARRSAGRLSNGWSGRTFVYHRAPSVLYTSGSSHHGRLQDVLNVRGPYCFLRVMAVTLGAGERQLENVRSVSRSTRQRLGGKSWTSKRISCGTTYCTSKRYTYMYSTTVQRNLTVTVMESDSRLTPYNTSWILITAPFAVQ